eukprot:tig00000950_g5762.t1
MRPAYAPAAEGGGDDWQGGGLVQEYGAGAPPFAGATPADAEDRGDREETRADVNWFSCHRCRKKKVDERGVKFHSCRSSRKHAHQFCSVCASRYREGQPCPVCTGECPCAYCVQRTINILQEASSRYPRHGPPRPPLELDPGHGPGHGQGPGGPHAQVRPLGGGPTPYNQSPPPAKRARGVAPGGEEDPRGRPSDEFRQPMRSGYVPANAGPNGHYYEDGRGVPAAPGPAAGPHAEAAGSALVAVIDDARGASAALALRPGERPDESDWRGLSGGGRRGAATQDAYLAHCLRRASVRPPRAAPPAPRRPRRPRGCPPVWWSRRGRLRAQFGGVLTVDDTVAPRAGAPEPPRLLPAERASGSAHRRPSHPSRGGPGPAAATSVTVHLDAYSPARVVYNAFPDEELARASGPSPTSSSSTCWRTASRSPSRASTPSSSSARARGRAPPPACSPAPLRPRLAPAGLAYPYAAGLWVQAQALRGELREALMPLVGRARSLFGIDPTLVDLVGYMDGKHHMAWHADDARLAPDPQNARVLSVSLSGRRWMEFRRKGGPRSAAPDARILLRRNASVLMAGMTQQRCAGPSGPSLEGARRVAIVFRELDVWALRRAMEEARGQGAKPPQVGRAVELEAWVRPERSPRFGPLPGCFVNEVLPVAEVRARGFHDHFGSSPRPPAARVREPPGGRRLRHALHPRNVDGYDVVLYISNNRSGGPALDTSLASGKPVRVFRSSKLATMEHMRHLAPSEFPPSPQSSNTFFFQGYPGGRRDSVGSGNGCPSNTTVSSCGGGGGPSGWAADSPGSARGPAPPARFSLDCDDYDADESGAYGASPRAGPSSPSPSRVTARYDGLYRVACRSDARDVTAILLRWSLAMLAPPGRGALAEQWPEFHRESASSVNYFLVRELGQVRPRTEREPQRQLGAAAAQILDWGGARLPGLPELDARVRSALEHACGLPPSDPGALALATAQAGAFEARPTPGGPAGPPSPAPRPPPTSAGGGGYGVLPPISAMLPPPQAEPPPPPPPPPQGRPDFGAGYSGPVVLLRHPSSLGLAAPAPQWDPSASPPVSPPALPAPAPAPGPGYPSPPSPRFSPPDGYSSWPPPPPMARTDFDA